MGTKGNTTETYPAYAIVSWGRTFGPAPKSYYRSLKSAQRDAARMAEYGGNVDIRIVGCPSVAAAKSADIGDTFPVIQHI